MGKIQDQGKEKIQLVTFVIGGENYGSEITKVQEIIWMAPITRVPKAVSHIIGVINLRGQIVPIISLTKRLNLNVETHRSNLSRIIVFKAKELVAGIIVDAVSEVVKMPVKDIDAVTELQTDVDFSYIEGVAKMPKKVVVILDIEKIILGEQEAGGGVNVA